MQVNIRIPKYLEKNKDKKIVEMRPRNTNLQYLRRYT